MYLLPLSSIRPMRDALVRLLLASALGGASACAHAAVTVGAVAPDFTLRSATGPNLRLQEQRGRVVLINFWATWCGPCRQEMPQLVKLYDKYKAAGFVVLGVSVDDDTRHASDVAARMGLNFPVLLDNMKTTSKLYDLATMPTTFIVDRDGKVRYIHAGYLNGYEDLYDKEIRGLLK